MSNPRILFAAPHGRSGKTTVVFSLIAALKKRGLKLQVFKKGPDYIDPSWHSVASESPCRNLDPFMMKSEDIIKSVAKHSKNRDLTIIEGAMGLFDGLEADGTGSTADLAKQTKTPVILVVSTERMTRSVAALVNGFVNFDKDLYVAGVILNKVAHGRHEQKLREAIEQHCQIPVVGIVPKRAWLKLPDRHLGLVPSGESSEIGELINKAIPLIEDHIDLDKLLNIASQAPDLPEANVEITKQKDITVKIGVIRDVAFSFYYQENIEALENFGAQIINIDSLKDQFLPDIDALYIGGGFPEMFATEISSNSALLNNIREKIEQGLPVYAECGGLMYLTRAISIDEVKYPMINVFQCEAEFGNKPQAHGYVKMRVQEGNPFFPAGTLLIGHKFHHSKVVNINDDKIKYTAQMERGAGIKNELEGLTYKNTFATYTHLHAISTPEWAQAFVNKAYDNKIK